MQLRIFGFLLFLFLVGCSTNVSKKEHSLYWQKHAAEYKALCIQAHNIAKSKIDQALKQSHDKPLAIIADIDETVLSNLPYNEMLIDSYLNFTQKTWSHWVNKQIATPIPGALDFYKYVDAAGVEIIYLSNRRVENYEATKANLIQAGFPFDEETIMLLRAETGNKEARRKQLDNFDIVLLLGDNLADFDAAFYKESNAERSKIVERLASQFGEEFILFPNLIYGSWEMGFEE